MLNTKIEVKITMEITPGHKSTDMGVVGPHAVVDEVVVLVIGIRDIMAETVNEEI